MDKINYTKLEKALKASEVELYASIGYAENQSLEALPKSFTELVEIGTHWFIQKEVYFKDLICPIKQLQKVGNDDSLSFEAATIIIDYFANLKVDFPLIPVVALIVKKGIKVFCHDYWR